MLSRDFEIYYYSDQRVTPVRPHTHNYYEFYFFLQGDVSIHVGDTSYPIRPDSFLVIPPDISHYPEFGTDTIPYQRFILWISREYMEHLWQASADFRYLIDLASQSHHYLSQVDSISFREIQSQLFLLIEEIRGNRFGRVSQISLQIDTLLLYLNRLVHDQQSLPRTTEERAMVPAICDYINTHIEEPLSLDRLSQEFFLSKFHISHTFQDEMGISIHQFILKKRLRLCRDAILSGMSISQAYELYGFRDYSSFYRSFKKEYGISPKEYRDLELNRL